jgi:adenylosuccinate synthase
MMTATGLPGSGDIVATCASASVIVVKKTAGSDPAGHTCATNSVRAGSN